MLKIGHSVTVPKTLRGPTPQDKDASIPIPEELETVPGIPQDAQTVDFYTRNYPLESHMVEQFAYQKWDRETTNIKEIVDEHYRLQRPNVKAASVSGEVEPTVEPVPGKDVTEEIKNKALELGFGMVGITAYDSRYTYKSKRNWVKPFPSVICLAMEQPYEGTQEIPSPPSEKAVYAIYRREGARALELADYIRSLGYHAQVQDPADASSAVIPMFVAAGMGQLGAMGYLLSPHFGSRHRLLIVTTDALVTHDEPVDYGIHAFCSVCQVCVNRCPGRAIMREKVWWRGVEKHKIIAKRCRPVMNRYSACGICMKVCPIQRYGLEPVMEHYAATGQVLGKGTDGLEGYDLDNFGYFGPGELPRFNTDFFHVPEGSAEQAVFDELRAKAATTTVPEGPEGDQLLQEMWAKLQQVAGGPVDYIAAEYDEDEEED